jgi:hypothetical protein
MEYLETRQNKRKIKELILGFFCHPGICVLPGHLWFGVIRFLERFFLTSGRNTGIKTILLLLTILSERKVIIKLIVYMQAHSRDKYTVTW